MSPLTEGNFTMKLRYSYFAVQSWTASELTATALEGACEVASVLRINFGKPKKGAPFGGSDWNDYPEATVTKTKTGPLKTDGLCKDLASDPYTMHLVAGTEAQAKGRLWWPFDKKEIAHVASAAVASSTGKTSVMGGF